MGLVVGLLVVLLILIVAIWVTSHLVGLVVMLFVAGLIGWLADRIVPGRLPYGWLGAIVAGLLGSWLGTLVLGSLGPELFGITIIPAILGAIVLAAGANVVQKATGRRRLQSGNRPRALDRKW